MCHNKNKASVRVMEKCGMKYLKSESISFGKEEGPAEIYIFTILNK
jgi:RimJ/RimL family protein N-acetyltransferase